MSGTDRTTSTSTTPDTGGVTGVRSTARTVSTSSHEHRFLAAPGETVLAVPAVPSWLVPARSRRGAPRIVRRMRRAREGAVALEDLLVGGRPALLAVFPRRDASRLNGAPAPRLALLRAGDALLLADGTCLRLVLRVRTRCGPPAPGQVGVPCALCRVPFAAETTVVACAGCGAVLHHEDEAARGPEALRCAEASGACPQCGRALDTSGEWTDVLDG